MEDIAKTCLVVLCGIPASGKTSIAHSIKLYSDVPVTIVSFDDFESAASDDDHVFSPEAWKESREEALDALRRSLSADVTTSTTTPRHHLVIADDTMHYRSMRKECYKIARECSSSYIQIHCICPISTALVRNQLRRSSSPTTPSDTIAIKNKKCDIPDDIIHKTASLFEDPSETDCIWDKNTYIVDSSVFNINHHASLPSIHSPSAPAVDHSTNINSLLNTIMNAWSRPVPKVNLQEDLDRKQSARIASASNRVHQNDLKTRHILSESIRKLRDVSDSVKVSSVDHLNAKRHFLLSLKIEDDEDFDKRVDEFEKYCHDFISQYTTNK